MARTRIQLNRRTLQQYLDGQHGVEAALNDRAERALARVEAASPIVSGDYVNSLHIETNYTDRMVKQVVADVPYAMQVEAKHGPMAKGLD